MNAWVDVGLETARRRQVSEVGAMDWLMSIRGPGPCLSLNERLHQSH